MKKFKKIIFIIGIVFTVVVLFELGINKYQKYKFNAFYKRYKTFQRKEKEKVNKYISDGVFIKIDRLGLIFKDSIVKKYKFKMSFLIYSFGNPAIIITINNRRRNRYYLDMDKDIYFYNQKDTVSFRAEVISEDYPLATLSFLILEFSNYYKLTQIVNSDNCFFKIDDNQYSFTKNDLEVFKRYLRYSKDIIMAFPVCFMDILHMGEVYDKQFKPINKKFIEYFGLKGLFEN